MTGYSIKNTSTTTSSSSSSSNNGSSSGNNMQILSVLNKELFQYLLYLPLYNNVSNTMIQDYVLQPARQNWIQSVDILNNNNNTTTTTINTSTTNNNLYHIKLSQFIPGKLGMLLSGGILGSDRLLTSLGAHVIDKVYLKAWHLPPIFPTPPASKAGIQVKLYMGISATTALIWSKPSLSYLNTLYTQHNKKKKEFNNNKERNNIIDYNLLNTTTKVKKKNIFNLFSSTTTTATNNNNNSNNIENKERNQNEYLEENDLIDYNIQETNENNEENKKEKKESSSTNKIPTQAFRSLHTIKEETGLLFPNNNIELEVVIKINFENIQLLQQVSSFFNFIISYLFITTVYVYCIYMIYHYTIIYYFYYIILLLCALLLLYNILQCTILCYYFI